MLSLYFKGTDFDPNVLVKILYSIWAPYEHYEQAKRFPEHF